MEPLDWTGAEAVAVRVESREAMSAYATHVLDQIEAGEPLHLGHAAIEGLLDRAELVAGTDRWGAGIEIGAGAGYASAALSRRPGVDRIYVLEHSRELVSVAMPRLWAATGADTAKLVPVVGSFDRLALPDASLDFALAIAALHHAEDLPGTLAELARVLRPDAWVFALERYQADEASDEDLASLLDMPLGNDLRELYGFEPGRTVTRRDVGEHEYRLSEWKRHFATAGFDVFAFRGIDFSGSAARRVAGLPWRGFLRVFWRRLLRARRTSLPYERSWLLTTPGVGAINLLLAAKR